MLMRPNADRARIAIVFLWIALALELVAGISDYLQLQFLHNVQNGIPVSAADADSNDQRQALIALVYLAVYITSLVFFIMWMRRAYYNLHRVVSNLSFGEGWAAGAWFVPFVNFVRPFRIMKEMAYETEQLLVRENLTEPKPIRTKIVGMWWAFWLLTNVGANISSRIQLKSDSLDTLVTTTTVDIVLAVLAIPLTILSVRMVREYAEMETLLPLVEKDRSRPIRIDDNDLLDSI